jgi:thiamine transport system substrate-binding protein
MIRKTILLGLLFALMFSACAAEPERSQTLRVMTHDSFAVSDDVVAAFEDQYDATVEFLASGDTGAALNKAILSIGNPIADVFYGVDNTYLSRALDAGIFESYQSPQLATIPAKFQLDPEHRALPVDYGDVCLNYDVAYFQGENLTPPAELKDLLKPEYRSMLVVQDPTTSSPGLAFLLATIAHFGEDDYLDYWRGLVENDLLVVSDWESAYYTEFSYWGGTRPLVVSYGSSVAFEFIFSDPPVEEEPTGAVLGTDACFRQIEFAGILKGTQNRDLAEKWIDFMLSTTFQKDMPFQMAVYPVNQEAQINEDFAAHSAIPEKPATLDPYYIAENRDAWIEAWREVVLH